MLPVAGEGFRVREGGGEGKRVSVSLVRQRLQLCPEYRDNPLDKGAI